MPGQQAAWSAEFRLALACCERNFADRPQSAMQTPQVDWAGFLQLVRFHRIEGLAWNSLSTSERIPAEVRLALSAAAAEIAAQNLIAAAASRELLDRFADRGIPLLFLKGLTAGALAYGKASLKAAIDIDLLIDPADLASAADLLRQTGFQPTTPDAADNDSLCRWHGGWKESIWAKRSPQLQIDLHTRTSDNRQLIPGIDVHSSCQKVSVGDGIALPTLADEELFAYLAVHGASSAWFRLKWISDFAGLLVGRSADDIGALYGASQDLGAGRAAGQALLLADSLFNTLEAAPRLRDELRADRGTRRLTQAAYRQVTAKPREPTEVRWGTLAIHWTQFLLLPGLGYKLSELLRQAKGMPDPQR
ncbi:MAG: nucleotidyltransferase family protein [Sphingomonas sp.]